MKEAIHKTFTLYDTSYRTVRAKQNQWNAPSSSLFRSSQEVPQLRERPGPRFIFLILELGIKALSLTWDNSEGPPQLQNTVIWVCFPRILIFKVRLVAFGEEMTGKRQKRVFRCTSDALDLDGRYIGGFTW